MTKLATIFAVLGLVTISTPSLAYWTTDVVAQSTAGASGRHGGYYPRHHWAGAHWARSAGRRSGSGNLVARSGARTSVSQVAQPHFQCLVDRLEAAGYRIAFMGGFGPRSNPSAHPTGNAVDINQTGFGRVTRRFPGNVEEMCSACGVYSGAHFGDYGHFEMLNKYGYVNIGRQYAYRPRHWRHRHYAGA